MGKVLCTTRSGSYHDMLLWPQSSPAGRWAQLAFLQAVPQGDTKMDFGRGWMTSRGPWSWRSCGRNPLSFLWGYGSCLNAGDIKCGTHLCLCHLPMPCRQENGLDLPVWAVPAAVEVFTGKLWRCQIVWKWAFRGPAVSHWDCWVFRSKRRARSQSHLESLNYVRSCPFDSMNSSFTHFFPQVKKTLQCVTSAQPPDGSEVNNVTKICLLLLKSLELAVIQTSGLQKINCLHNNVHNVFHFKRLSIGGFLVYNSVITD